MIKVVQKDGNLELVTSLKSRYDLIVNFGQSEIASQYTLKATEGLYLMDLYNGSIYEILDIIKLKDGTTKFVFTVVKDTDKQRMIMYL